MFFVNSANTESQVANVVPGKYSNRDFESADSTYQSQRIYIQHLISLRKWPDAVRPAGLTDRRLQYSSPPLGRQ